MVDDVTVGEVTDVERVGWHARVTLRVRDDVELPDNAIADIRQVSLLGEKYVALEAPDGRRVRRAGSATATTSRSPRPAATPRSRRCSARCRSCSAAAASAQLGTIIEELNKVMSGREDRLRGTCSARSRTSSARWTTQKADIIRAMESMNNLTATLNAERQTDHRRARRHRAGDRGAGRPARRARSTMLGVAGPARRGRHPGDPGEQGRPDRRRSTHLAAGAAASCTRPATSWPPASTCWSASRSRRRPPRSSRATTPTPRSAPRSAWTTCCRRAAATRRPTIPPIELPDPGEVLSDVQKCLQSGDIASDGVQEGARRRRPAGRAQEAVHEGQVRRATRSARSSTRCPTCPLDELPDVLDDLLDGVLGRSLEPGCATARRRLRRHPRSVRRCA